MRWLWLYLRCRRVPVALAATTGCVVLMWSMWSIFSNDRDVAPQMVALTLLLLVTALTATLGGPDDALEGTAAFRWRPRRAAHLLAALLVVVALPLATLATGARFGPAWLLLRDAAGLLGLTALSAAAIGVPRAWFAPLGWTLAAILFPQASSTLGSILTWQAQPRVSTAAALTATVLAITGLIAYALAGPARRPPAEAAQH